MTPQEKAEGLIVKFINSNQEKYGPLVEITSIKQAIECTGEIISSIQIIKHLYEEVYSETDECMRILDEKLLWWGNVMRYLEVRGIVSQVEKFRCKGGNKGRIGGNKGRGVVGMWK